jgi:tetratricopeptide (TPR) repeat protein
VTRRKPVSYVVVGIILVVVAGATFILKDTLFLGAQIARYSAILASDPGNYDATFGLGLAYFKSKDYSKAADFYIKASQLKPESVLAFNNLGNTYRKLSRYEDSEKAYLDAISIGPTYITAYTNLVSLYETWPANKADKRSEIPKVLERGIIATNNNPTLLRAIITYYNSVGDTKNADKYQEVLSHT